LVYGITLHLQNEKQDNIREKNEEFELHLEDVHAKYDGIISTIRVIKHQEKR